MKKLILLIIFLAALCVSARADMAVLVYKVTMQAQPWRVDVNEPTLIVGDTKTDLKLNGALVFDVNTDTLEPFQWVYFDSNDACKLFLWGTDIDKSRIYNRMWGIGGNIRFQKAADAKGGDFVLGQWAFFAEPNLTTGTPWSSWATFYGKTVPTAIVQGGNKVLVPRTMKGIGQIIKGYKDWSFGNGYGSGPVTLTLDLSITRRVNQGGIANTTMAEKYVMNNSSPQPDPLTWVSPPSETGSSTSRTQSMQCSGAYSQSPPVYYKFVCIDDNRLSSDWQTSTSYSVVVGTSHNYRWYCIAKDSLGNTSKKKNAGLVIQH